jgi:peptide-methionine (R)-S-oxide reductase
MNLPADRPGNSFAAALAFLKSHEIDSSGSRELLVTRRPVQYCSRKETAMYEINRERRRLLGGVALAAFAVPSFTAIGARAQSDDDGDFVYEVTRSEEEWRERLSDFEYHILRNGGTEPRFSSSLWNEEREGHYDCRGCDLKLYDSEWKTIREIGWVFFRHSVPNSTLTGIDPVPAGYDEEDEMSVEEAMIETHCRRCGSHLGHILLVQGDVLHCINGASLEFTSTA